MISKNVFSVAAFVLLLVSCSFAAVPQMINYQGKLADNAGACVNDTVAMVFTIYSDSVAPNPLWTETHNAVVVEGGIFNVLLGSSVPVDASIFDGNISFLGVRVGTDPEMTPRKPLVSVGYAYRASQADTAEYAHIAAPDNDWVVNGDNIYHEQGNVSIGTTTPGVLLEVNGVMRTLSKPPVWAPVGKGLEFYYDETSDQGLIESVDRSDGLLIRKKLVISGTPLHFATSAVTRMFIDTDGKVGIGTTTPANILTVVQNSTTDPIADAWTIYSSREYKRDIRELTENEYREALENLASVPVVKFHYRGEDSKEKIGIIAEDAPEQILAEGDQKAVSLNEYIALLHAALKAQQNEIELLTARLEKVETKK